jgi:Ca2+-binding RTX toxin-like protein
LKSKGSSAGGAGDADAGDGQGLSNGSRSRAASELADWLATAPTGSSDPDVLILGDLNSYLQEDPIRILASRGYRSLFDADSYSYQFNGQWGSLDHMLASDSLYSQVSGSGKWHINSDEPIILDYNIEFKSTAQQASFYNADPFRTSDHDPLLAGLSLTPNNRPPTDISISTSSCDENIAAGSSIAILSSSDPDTSNSFTYTLVAGSGAADNDSFSISGSNLIINSSPNYEAKSSYSLRLRSTDQGGLFTEKEFTFLVNNLIEEISSDASTTLPSDYNNLLLTGDLNINGTGNSSDNSLTGNAGKNSLYGLAGNDQLFGRDGDDTLDGGLGDDTMDGGAGNDSFYVNSIGDFCYDAPGEGTDTVISSIGWALVSYIENLTLTGANDINAWGNEWNNLLVGNSGNNVLNGNGGLDTMIGGIGDDKYVVDNIADVVVEDISGGLDWVESSVNWIMGSNLENLILTGGANLSGTGNALDNRIKGNIGDNILDGGQGRDNLIGDAGADIFKFSNLPSYGAGNADRILDFSGSSGDRLLISIAAFGITNASASLINTNSTDLANALKTNNLFVYNTSNGHLYHNANGSAGSFGNGGIFAVFTNAAALQTDWISLY